MLIVITFFVLIYLPLESRPSIFNYSHILFCSFEYYVKEICLRKLKVKINKNGQIYF